MKATWQVCPEQPRAAPPTEQEKGEIKQRGAAGGQVYQNFDTMRLQDFLTRFKTRLMEPLLIEVSCNLPPDDPRWEHISSLSLELGYRGLNGKTIWKHIGWLREQLLPSGRSFAHALWKSTMADHVLVFDFLPVPYPGSAKPEQNYRLRKRITTPDGQQKTVRSGLLIGDYSDEHFSLHPVYPQP